jgi:signal peptidase I
MRRFEVVDRSMEPALMPGDYLIATRRAPRLGDVVVFERTGFHLVKRVVATAGELVEIDSGQLLVGGRLRDMLGDFHHLEPSGRWKVPDASCFVLSDARTATAADSRSFGPVQIDSMWVVVLRYWPAGRIGTDFRPVAPPTPT